jgi:uncharacterized protein (TIGR00106 family)
LNGNRVIAEFSIVPVGQDSTSLSSWVAKAVEAIDGVQGVDYELTPMGTILEAGSLSEILRVVEAANEALFRHGALRTLLTLRADDRRDKPRSRQDKVASVCAEISAKP